ncbi:MAG: hypothetical protein J4452_00390 [Candidatus Aenigmarchaeota archaeon]|nr:hypothetical protein [Candidatus Aenigmarchaeota archaeon]
MKGQSLVIQFVLFFIIGFGLYLAIGNFFKIQSESFRSEITDDSIKLANSYLTSNILVAADSCKMCDYVNLTFKIENTTAGYYYALDLSKPQVNISVVPFANKSFITSGHNMNTSFSFKGNSSSIKTLTLTLNRTKNEIGIS